MRHRTKNHTRYAHRTIRQVVFSLLCLSLYFDTAATARGGPELRFEPEQAAGRWIRCAGPSGGGALALLVSRNKIFAGGNGIHFSASSDVLWEESVDVQSNVRILTLVDNGAALFAGSEGDGVLRSTDGGVSWRRVNNGLPGGLPIIIAFGSIGQTLIVGTNGDGLFRSTNNGDSWTRLAGFPSNVYVNRLISDDAEIYAATNANSLYRSTNNGDSWEQVKIQTTSEAVFAVALQGDTILASRASNLFASEALYRSTNRGASWTMVGAGLPARGEISEIALDEADVLVALGNEDGRAGGVYRSTDNGENFSALGDNLADVPIAALAVQDDRIIAANKNVIFRFDAAANHWQEATAGIFKVNVQRLIRIGARLFAGTTQGGYLSENNGMSWARLGKGLPSITISGFAAMGDALFASVVDEYIDRGGVYRSTDNGATWAKSSQGLPRSSVFGVIAQGSRLIAATSENGMYVSNDNGWRWQTINAGYTVSSPAVGLYRVNNQVYAGTYGGNFTLAEGATNWTRLNGVSEAIWGMTVSGDAIFAVTNSDGIFRSTDGGQIWTRINERFTSLPHANTALAVIGSRLYATVNGGGVYVSTDNGVKWTPTNTGLPTQLMNTLAASDGVLLAAPRQSGLFVYSESSRPLANVSAAGYQANEPLARGSIAAAFGEALALTTEAATTLPLPLSLAGTSVRVRDSKGIERFARLFAVTPGQINYQIPEDSATGPATITVLGGDASVFSGPAQISAVAPAIFSANSNGRGVAAAVVLRVKDDGSQSYELPFQYDPVRREFLAAPIEIGADQVFLLLYATGVRNRSALEAVSAIIGDAPAPVDYAGPAPGFFGLDQTTVRLPQSLAGRGLTTISLLVENIPANSVEILIR
jgi:uncharacterized protein (TIGR03437 family)